MGSKIASRELMRAAGVPIVPGHHGARRVAADEVVRLGDEYGWPIAIKAAAGGGGQGPEGRRARPTRPSARYQSARREGEAYFSDSTVYVEKYIEDPRHVEVQVLADAHGTVLHLGERDCTIQRRHQKLDRGDALAGGRRRAARADRRNRRRGGAGRRLPVGRDDRGPARPSGNYYFLEMNTRIQVEHTVTEMVTGIDLVREQILIAAGEPISFGQEDVRFAGHAIECRINAEDPSNGFLPSPGTITAYREPAGPGVRVDSGVDRGLGDPGALRPDDREADRLGPRPRERAETDAARPGRVRDRRRLDARRLPHGAAHITRASSRAAPATALVESELIAERARKLDALGRHRRAQARRPAGRASASSSPRSTDGGSR